MIFTRLAVDIEIIFNHLARKSIWNYVSKDTIHVQLNKLLCFTMEIQMISRKSFKILVSISLCWMLITIIASYIVPTDLNPILQSQVDLQLDRPWSNFDTITALILLAVLISHVSLLFFKSWARMGYLVLVPALFVITLLSGPAIYSSFDSFSSEVDVFISGILWSALMFTNIKSEFSGVSKA